MNKIIGVGTCSWNWHWILIFVLIIGLAAVPKSTFAIPLNSSTNSSGVSFTQHVIVDLYQEARIILPQEDNNGIQLGDVKDELELKLLEYFGGFTNVNGVGGWTSDNKTVHHEPIWVYDIASPNNNQSNSDLINIATWLKQNATQQSIYLRLPNGQVLFV